MSYKNVTFCVKTFNRPETVKFCLRHLIQHARDNKIIVCDDSTVDVKYPKDILDRITLIKTEPNIGVARGRNLLMKAVDTEYLFLTDDDQIIIRDWEDTYSAIPTAWMNDLVMFPVYEKKTNYYIGGCRFEKCLIPDGYLVCVRPVDNPPYHAGPTNFFISTENANKVYRDECQRQKGEHFSWHWKLYNEFPELKIQVMPDEYLSIHYTIKERFSEEYSRHRNPDIDISNYLKKINVVRYHWILQYKKLTMPLPDFYEKDVNSNRIVDVHKSEKTPTNDMTHVVLSVQDLSEISKNYKNGFIREIKNRAVCNAGKYILLCSEYEIVKSIYKL